MPIFAPWLLACTLVAPAPDVTGVTPTKGYNGYATDIEIEGDRFYPSVVVDGEEDGGGRVEAAFRAWLETDPPTPLEAVYHVSYDRLKAEIPAGLEPGVYALRVRAPSGSENTLENAFTVTSTLADHLRLDVDAAGYEVGINARLNISLEDPADQPVTLPMEVEIRAASGTGASGVAFQIDNGLDGMVALEDGAGVRGMLAPDGTGKVRLTSSVPDDVTITATAVDHPEVDPPDPLVLSWDPGQIASIEIALPRTDFRAVAGEAFDVVLTVRDAQENVLDLEDVYMILYEDPTCGSFGSPETVTGSLTVSVTLTESCAADRFHVIGPNGIWSSADFRVLAADPSSYTLDASPSSVVAGDNGLFVLVTAVDAFGNTVDAHAATVVLHDDAGGLNTSRGVGYANCPGFPVAGPAIQRCTVGLWVAAPGVVVTAVDASGLTGTAPAVEVVPDVPVDLVVSLSENSAIAGEPFDVLVRAVDAWGNSVAFDPAAGDDVFFSDSTGTIACALTGPLSGAQLFACIVEGADPGDELLVEALGLSAAGSDPIAIENAELAAVEIIPQGVSFTAGVAFPLNIRGVDAYGNPYAIQTDPDLDLADGTGSLSPSGATLDSNGEATVSASITVADAAVVIAASRGGAPLGSARAITVAAAEMDGFDVVAPPWIVLGEPGAVTVTAVDAFGNAVPSYAGLATLASAGDHCDVETITEFLAGTAHVALECGTAAASDTLTVEDDDGFTGSSAGVDVVDLECADGPVAELLLEGGTSSVTCLSAGLSSVGADASGSTPGSSPIIWNHFVDSDGNEVRSIGTSTTLEYRSAGTRRVEVLVMDARACGSIATGFAYVGEDDGEPTGPITVTAAASSVVTGGSTTVTIEAEDCTGDVAAGEELLVRADLGVVSGASTGAGLAHTLDASGAGTLTWTFDTGYAGTATVYLSSASGGAFGSDSVSVTQDQALPTVVSLSPTGTYAGMVTSIRVEFSEPMLAGNLVASNFTLSGPSGAVTFSVVASSELRAATILPIDPVDASAGEWTLTISNNVRDTAGNRLDGTWSGSGSAFTGTFGSVPDTLPSLTACPADHPGFIPDGDDAADVEADAAVLTLTSSGAPTWWVWSVHDGGGDRVRSGREPGASAGVSWDGRGDDGIIVGSDTYTIAVAALDSHGNVSAACPATIAVEQHVESP